MKRMSPLPTNRNIAKNAEKTLFPPFITPSRLMVVNAFPALRSSLAQIIPVIFPVKTNHRQPRRHVLQNFSAGLARRRILRIYRDIAGRQNFGKIKIIQGVNETRSEE